MPHSSVLLLLLLLQKIDLVAFAHGIICFGVYSQNTVNDAPLFDASSVVRSLCLLAFSNGSNIAMYLILQVHTGGVMKLKHSCSASMGLPGRARNS